MRGSHEYLSLLEPSGMHSEALPFHFRGELTHDTLHWIADNTEKAIAPLGLGVKVNRRVYHITIELLQNALRHGATETGNPWSGQVAYRLEMGNNELRIFAANLIDNHQIPTLKSRLESLNNSSKEALKCDFMEQLLQGQLSDKGGAGLGLIDIVRKSHGPLEYGFCEAGHDTSVFFVCARVVIV